MKRRDDLGSRRVFHDAIFEGASRKTNPAGRLASQGLSPVETDAGTPDT